ncbi:MAG: response regulator transcription factor [Akkermansiaceae bacterium]|nr:response regulator transcription factor [Akkermansiaceae bacterium]
METPTILVVEDDAAVRQGIVDALSFAGYEVLSEADGLSGRETALRARYNLLMLDLVMPGCSGFDVLEAIKKERPGQPVIILSARGEEGDRVKGLKMGADDYVVKPFSVRELLARVDAVLRRSTERPAAVKSHRIHGAEIDFARREVRFEDGSREELSERESELLRYFVSQAGRAVPRDELLRQVWGIDPRHIETRTVDMHVAHLRQKLRKPDALVTVRGKGYMLESAS